MTRTESNGLAIMRAADRRKDRRDDTPEGRLGRARGQAEVARKQTLGVVEGTIKGCWDLGCPIPHDAQDEMTRKARAEYEERVDSIAAAFGFTFVEVLAPTA